MGPVGDYKDLEAWQVAMDLAQEIYGVVRGLPAQEQYGLTSQMCRCAVSIPSNIAEGYGRGSTQDYVRFLRHSRGSAAELETQLILVERLGWGNNEQAMALVKSCQRLLHGLIRSLSS